MKTMKDFAGTEGRFIVFGIDQTTVTALPHKVILDGSNYDLSWKEAQANAKLFANSKRVLEAAINLLKIDRANDLGHNYPEMDALEQAINDSL